MKSNYRIQTKDKRFLNAGTDEPSWFTLEKAREIVGNRTDLRIVQHDGVNVLWEVL